MIETIDASKGLFRKVIRVADDFNDARRMYRQRKIQDNSNCYTYALDLHEHGIAVPGKLRTPYDDDDTGANTAQGLFNRLVDDGLIPVTYNEIKKDLDRPVIAAAVSERAYYHACRRHYDGFWSWQNGRGGPLSDLDESGRLILNPEKADWGGFDTFVGIFAIPEDGLIFGVRDDSPLLNRQGDPQLRRR